MSRLLDPTILFVPSRTVIGLSVESLSVKQGIPGKSSLPEGRLNQ